MFNFLKKLFGRKSAPAPEPLYVQQFGRATRPVPPDPWPPVPAPSYSPPPDYSCPAPSPSYDPPACSPPPMDFGSPSPSPDSSGW